MWVTGLTFGASWPGHTEPRSATGTGSAHSVVKDVKRSRYRAMNTMAYNSCVLSEIPACRRRETATAYREEEARCPSVKRTLARPCAVNFMEQHEEGEQVTHVTCKPEDVHGCPLPTTVQQNAGESTGHRAMVRRSNSRAWWLSVTTTGQGHCKGGQDCFLRF